MTKEEEKSKSREVIAQKIEQLSKEEEAKGAMKRQECLGKSSWWRLGCGSRLCGMEGIEVKSGRKMSSLSKGRNGEIFWKCICPERSNQGSSVFLKHMDKWLLFTELAFTREKQWSFYAGTPEENNLSWR